MGLQKGNGGRGQEECLELWEHGVTPEKRENTIRNLNRPLGKHEKK